MTVFVDTNIAAYALDASDPVKQQQARAVLGGDPRPRTSPQVLRELYVVAVSKLAMATADAAAAVRALAPTVAVVEDAALMQRAITSSARWQISLWDALIVEAARRANADTVYSEDLQNGMDFDGVRVRNPFVE